MAMQTTVQPTNRLLVCVCVVARWVKIDTSDGLLRGVAESLRQFYPQTWCQTFTAQQIKLIKRRRRRRGLASGSGMRHKEQAAKAKARRSGACAACAYYVYAHVCCCCCCCFFGKHLHSARRFGRSRSHVIEHSIQTNGTNEHDNGVYICIYIYIQREFAFMCVCVCDGGRGCCPTTLLCPSTAACHPSLSSCLWRLRICLKCIAISSFATTQR